MRTIQAMTQAREALEVAQDNLRPHGDNCFLHDEGEYNRCFCGKDSLSDYLQEVVEKLDTAIKQALAAPVQREHVTDKSCWCQPALDYKDPDNGAEVWVHNEPH